MLNQASPDPEQLSSRWLSTRNRVDSGSAEQHRSGSVASGRDGLRQRQVWEGNQDWYSLLRSPGGIITKRRWDFDRAARLAWTLWHENGKVCWDRDFFHCGACLEGAHPPTNVIAR
jgi:hypothetical protein